MPQKAVSPNTPVSGEGSRAANRYTAPEPVALGTVHAGRSINGLHALGFGSFITSKLTASSFQILLNYPLIAWDAAETAVAFSPGFSVPLLIGGKRVGTTFMRPAISVLANNACASTILTWSDDGRTWHACDDAGRADPHVSPTDRCRPFPKHPQQANWRGDPCLGTPPTGGGIVVAANLANSLGDSGNPNMIVAPVSLDGGRTFLWTEYVNEKGCSNGDQDQQHLAFDPRALEPVVWIAWRHRGVDKDLGGSYGICIRGGTVNPGARKIDWFSDSIDVQNLKRQDFGGVGGLLVAPMLNVITIMYADTDKEVHICATDPTSAYPKTVSWYTVTSFNGGETWQDSKLVLRTDQFSRCAIGYHYENGLRAFGFARDNVGRLWAAINDTPGSIQILVSRDEGLSWDAVMTFGNDQPFSYGGPYLPTLATDGLGHVALAFYGGDGPSSAAYFFAVRRAGYDPLDPNAWTKPRRISRSFNTGNPIQTTGARWLGDYNSITAVPPGTFGEPRAQFLLAWVERNNVDAEDCPAPGNRPGTSHLFAALVPVP